VWAEIGGYDESLFSNEDYDFNHRVRQSGRLVMLATDIRSQYGARPTIVALGRQYFRYGFWKTQMLKKSPAALRLRQVLPVLLLPWIGVTAVLAFTMTGGITIAAAALYPALIAAAVVQMTATHGDARLLAPAFAVILVQHSAWSAGFWHGLFYPPHRPS